MLIRESRGYLAYMLRLWQVGEDAEVWRAAVENAHTGARHGFANLDDLFVFLKDQTGQNLSPAGEACLDSGESHDSDSEPAQGMVDGAPSAAREPAKGSAP